MCRALCRRQLTHTPCALSRPLEDGDIVSIDVSCFLDGHHGDNCRTFYCGNVSDEAKQLVEVTKEALDAAIAICGPGVPYHLIGEKIQSKADQFGYSVIRNYTGHGIGSTFHTLPYILHFASPPYSSMVAGTVATRVCAHARHRNVTVGRCLQAPRLPSSP